MRSDEKKKKDGDAIVEGSKKKKKNKATAVVENAPDCKKDGDASRITTDGEDSGAVLSVGLEASGDTIVHGSKKKNKAKNKATAVVENAPDCKKDGDASRIMTDGEDSGAVLSVGLEASGDTIVHGSKKKNKAKNKATAVVENAPDCKKDGDSSRIMTDGEDSGAVLSVGLEASGDTIVHGSKKKNKAKNKATAVVENAPDCKKDGDASRIMTDGEDSGAVLSVGLEASGDTIVHGSKKKNKAKNKATAVVENAPDCKKDGDASRIMTDGEDSGAVLSVGLEASGDTIVHGSKKKNKAKNKATAVVENAPDCKKDGDASRIMTDGEDSGAVLSVGLEASGDTIVHGSKKKNKAKNKATAVVENAPGCKKDGDASRIMTDGEDSGAVLSVGLEASGDTIVHGSKKKNKAKNKATAVVENAPDCKKDGDASRIMTDGEDSGAVLSVGLEASGDTIVHGSKKKNKAKNKATAVVENAPDCKKDGDASRIMTDGEDSGAVLSVGLEASGDTIVHGSKKKNKAKNKATAVVENAPDCKKDGDSSRIMTDGEDSGAVLSVGLVASGDTIVHGSKKKNKAKNKATAVVENAPDCKKDGDASRIMTDGEDSGAVLSVGLEASGDTIVHGSKKKNKAKNKATAVVENAPDCKKDGDASRIMTDGEDSGAVLSVGLEASGDTIVHGSKKKNKAKNKATAVVENAPDCKKDGDASRIMTDGEDSGAVLSVGLEASGDTIVHGSKKKNKAKNKATAVVENATDCKNDGDASRIMTDGEDSGAVLSVGLEASGDTIVHGSKKKNKAKNKATAVVENAPDCKKDGDASRIMTDGEDSGAVLSVGLEASGDTIVHGSKKKNKNKATAVVENAQGSLIKSQPTTSKIKGRRATIDTSHWPYLLKGYSELNNKNVSFEQSMAGCTPGSRPISEYIHRGTLNLMKPGGSKSSTVVADIKNILGVKKLCHGGKVGGSGKKDEANVEADTKSDEKGSGVMVVCLEQAARLVTVVQKARREYEFTVTIDGFEPGFDRSEKSIASIIGKALESINNVPIRPGSSTKKRVFSVRFKANDEKGSSFTFRIVCEGGTHVSGFCSHLATTLEGVKNVRLEEESIVCRKAGTFDIDTAVTVEDVRNAYRDYNVNKDETRLRSVIIPLEAVLTGYRRLVVKETAVHMICRNAGKGGFVMIEDLLRFESRIEDGDEIVVMTARGEAVALGTAMMTSAVIGVSNKGCVAKVKTAIMDENQLGVVSHPCPKGFDYTIARESASASLAGPEETKLDTLQEILPRVDALEGKKKKRKSKHKDILPQVDALEGKKKKRKRKHKDILPMGDALEGKKKKKKRKYEDILPAVDALEEGKKKKKKRKHENTGGSPAANV